MKAGNFRSTTGQDLEVHWPVHQSGGFTTLADDIWVATAADGSSVLVTETSLAEAGYEPAA